MPRLMLSKSTLSSERKKLASYQRFLPSLDLKRQQLRQAQKKCQVECDTLQQSLEKVMALVGEQLPMLANSELKLDNLLTLKSVDVGYRNYVGCLIPELKTIELERADFPVMSAPHWFSSLQDHLAEAAKLRAEIALKREQQKLLDTAVVKITQRVNLFENVLIPTGQSNIKRIQIYLGDREREAVVASKIAKNRSQSMGVE